MSDNEINNITSTEDKEKSRFIQKNLFDRDFDIIYLPSKGKYYKNNKSSLMVRYISALEERLLVSPLLNESGKGLKFMLQNVIIDDDIKIEDLLISDIQGILMFLRSTAYGDILEFKAECPHCNHENELNIQLSSLQFKKPKLEPDEDGNFIFSSSNPDILIKFKPLTFENGLDVSNGNKHTFTYKDGKEVFEFKRYNTEKAINSIVEINGISDKDKIRNIILNLPKKIFDELKKIISENEVGVENIREFECEDCGNTANMKFNFGNNILALPPSHKEVLNEELFLLTYYGKNINYESAERMPVSNRRWFLKRILEEMEKKKKAEEDAVNKVKRNKGSKPGKIIV